MEKIWIKITRRVDMEEKIRLLEEGLKTAFIDGNYNSNLAYRPQFVSNDYKTGKKVLSSDNLLLILFPLYFYFQVLLMSVTMEQFHPW